VLQDGVEETRGATLIDPTKHAEGTCIDCIGGHRARKIRQRPGQAVGVHARLHLFSPNLHPVLTRGTGDEDAVSAPQVPTRRTVGQTVLAHPPHCQLEHAMHVRYQAQVQATGGREGRVVSSDGVLELPLTTPRALGGAGGRGTNPAQLFAAGYAASFLCALQDVAARDTLAIPPESWVESTVGPVELMVR
jgi:hypothetical protein